MHITIIGTGYVGLVTGACLAELGCTITCVDKDTTKIARLKKGEIPIFEPGLDEVVIRNYAAGRLAFSDNLKEEAAKSDVIFLAVGTPTNEKDGSADLSYIFAAVDEIAASITKPCVVVTKSTVPVGTGKRIAEKLAQQCKYPCDVVSNPEFLREGSAVKDFLEPDRIVVGVSSGHAREVMRKLYWNLIDRNVPIVFTDIPTAELIKYAANAYLATRIAFMNEIANLCEQVGATVEDVAKGMGLDNRIGPRYLQPGPGYGGSCFPKDTKALCHTASGAGTPTTIVEAVIASNEERKRLMAEKIITAAGGSVKAKTIAILGTAFKANTDDMRDAASLVILPILLQAGATLRAYDPEAMQEAQKLLTQPIIWCNTTEEALEGADLAVILTEWECFKQLDLTKLSVPLLIDLRNLFSKDAAARAKIHYVAIGRPEVLPEEKDTVKLAT